jgi:hypothetical protein
VSSASDPGCQYDQLIEINHKLKSDINRSSVPQLSSLCDRSACCHTDLQEAIQSHSWPGKAYTILTFHSLVRILELQRTQSSYYMWPKVQSHSLDGWATLVWGWEVGRVPTQAQIWPFSWAKPKGSSKAGVRCTVYFLQRKNLVISVEEIYFFL